MKKLLIAANLLITSTTFAQPQYAAPDGGGVHNFPHAQCVSEEQRADIQKMLDANRQVLLEKGILTDHTNKKTTAVKFDWPLKQAAGFNYNSIYAISNFVDHNVSYPNQISDWNCGTRSYDLSSGYNHAGMDIYLWPFYHNMMDADQAEIIAAAPGIITAKTDGNFDKNCAMGGGMWNAVYVEHADGTVAWYGHMKKNSLTAKPIGAAVVTGEVLGRVGSSGSSTGPHLHFELHNIGNITIDPYFGTCNIGGSLWNNQKPYYESAINTLMTHYAVPAFNPCPMPANIYARDTFLPIGNTIYFGAYYRDQMAGQNTVYTVYRPDNTIFDTWSHSATSWGSSSWWYWSRAIPASEMQGKWKFEADYEGKTVSHNFQVGTTTAIADNKVLQAKVYPNPARNKLYIKAAQNITGVSLKNCVGQVMYSATAYDNEGIDVTQFPSGLYILNTTIAGKEEQQKIMIAR